MIKNKKLDKEINSFITKIIKKYKGSLYLYYSKENTKEKEAYMLQDKKEEFTSHDIINTMIYYRDNENKKGYHS